MKFRVVIEPQGRLIELAAGDTLRDALFDAGVEFPCGGKGRCGSCRVRLLDGELEPTPVERDCLSPRELAEGWRFACRASPRSDIRLHVEQWETPILDSHHTMGSLRGEGFGVAVDLGTTTIVAQLLDLRSGDVLAVEKCLNPQASRGADLISRIDYAGSPEGFDELVSSVRNRIGALIAALVSSSGIDVEGLKRIVIAGNTVMHHLFSGLDVSPLSRVPFESDQGSLQRFSVAELGWPSLGAVEVWVLPALGGFVGGDILACILATRMHQCSELVALVDLGTNGEIVVGNSERMLCTSTSAGPAFEGGGISRGMRATAGAIDAVEIDGNRLRCHVIGGQAARGVCGSGIVDAVAAALELGWVDSSGRVVLDDKRVPLTRSIHLSQLDIRQLQLAKGAIAAGFSILSDQLGVGSDDITTVFLAGAFGNYISVGSARRIGLLSFSSEQIQTVGNSALLGAKLALGSEGNELFDAIRARVEHIALADCPDFQQGFIEATAFPAA
jgi:uncharacterized 2Fe-2S/4Fe-4S cluster protein (DUF4445 family)